VVASRSQVPLTQYPDMIPLVSVRPCAGRERRVIRNRSHEVLEEEPTRLYGIKLLSSSEPRQVSAITIEFQPQPQCGCLRTGRAATRSHVCAGAPQLPDEVDEPVISKLSADAQAIFVAGTFLGVIRRSS